MTRSPRLRALALVVGVLLPAAARGDILPAPARAGDLSFGLGPALVLEGGEASPGVTGELNLLVGAFSLGAHGRAAFGDEVAPAVGVEAAVLGMLGAGASWRPGGLSIDGLLQVPLPILPTPFFLSVGWRPMFLLAGGVEHEVALQIKWSSLLLPDDG